MHSSENSVVSIRIYEVCTYFVLCRHVLCMVCVCLMAVLKNVRAIVACELSYFMGVCSQKY